MASFDVSATSNVNPYTFPAGWANYNGNWKVESNILKSVSVDLLTVALVTSTVSSGVQRITFDIGQASTVNFDRSGVAFCTTSGNGYVVLFMNGTVQVFVLTAFALGSGFTADTGNTWAAGDTFTVDFTIAGASSFIDVYQNSVSTVTPMLTTTGLTYTSGQAEGVVSQFADSNAAGIISADNALAASVTIDSTPADIRVTESRTIRVTAPTTAMTTGNTSVKIDDAGNAAITPSAVTNISGLTYDVVFTVPDEYAGLKYDATGYTIIVSTADGTVTSGNIDYLPVTGNDYVNATSVPGDFDTSLGTLAIGDQVEYETNSGEISVGADLLITSTNPNTTFSARAWDETDSTWGDWALQTLGTGGEGGGGADGISFAGLSSAGISSAGLSS